MSKKNLTYFHFFKKYRKNKARGLKIRQMRDINPQFQFQLQKMHPDVKFKLKNEIEVFLLKNPDASQTITKFLWYHKLKSLNSIYNKGYIYQSVWYHFQTLVIIFGELGAIFSDDGERSLVHPAHQKWSLESKNDTIHVNIWNLFLYNCIQWF